jgi:iron(III) transport system substrate-binding protein
MTHAPESRRSELTRRDMLRLTAAGALAALAGGCDRSPTPPAASNTPVPAKPAPAPPSAARSLVVYCSADADLASPIFAAFTKQTGVAINPVFDTEATKTTGLTNRLLQEKDRPRADLWWSSEPFGTIKLARAGVLDDSTSDIAESDMKDRGGWPRLLRDQKWTTPATPEAGAKGPRWYGFGSRARVVVYNTKFVPKEEAPTAYNMFLVERFKGRIAMAKPQFGTTRGHMAMLVDAWDKGPFGDWLSAMKQAEVRLYDGNSAVVRAVANGEAHVGFTDSDDVFAGQREGWPVAMSFIQCPDPNTKRVDRFHPRWAEMQHTAKTGTLLIPNTIARVRGGPNAADAPAFIDFLLSKPTQRIMAQSESRNVPVDPDLARELSTWLPPEEHIASIDFEDACDVMDAAMELCTNRLS